jgi:WXG100 family type VII secretion target
MTRYNVDSEQVLLAATAARASITRLQGEVQALNSQLHALQSSWSGPAASAFTSVHSAWHATQVGVEQNLQALSEALGHAGRHYEEMEAANTRLFLH